MSVSRKRKILTLEEKVKVIRLNEKGDGSRIIATNFGVEKTQINNIILSKDSILKQWQGGTDGGRKLVKARRCLYPDLNDKVLEWFCAQGPKMLNNTMRLEGRRTLLFMGNCGAHPHVELSNIKLAFFAPNTTARLQLMDLGSFQQ
jgi:hypothetical protein